MTIATVATIAASLVVISLFFFVERSAPFIISIVAIMSTLWVAHWFVRHNGKKWSELEEVSHLFQGAAALVTICVVFVAAGIYFLERRDRSSFGFSLEGSAIQVGKKGEVLLSVRAPVENRGARKLKLKCIALELNGLTTDRLDIPKSRTPGFPEEVELPRLEDKIPYQSGSDCRSREEQFRHWRAGSIRPYFMWDPLRLEPGETNYLYFETPISCKYSIIRLLLKMRPTPEYKGSIETKLIVPISDVCKGKREISVATTDASVQAEAQSPDAQSQEAEPELVVTAPRPAR